MGNSSGKSIAVELRTPLDCTEGAISSLSIGYCFSNETLLSERPPAIAFKVIVAVGTVSVQGPDQRSSSTRNRTAVPIHRKLKIISATMPSRRIQ